MELVNIDAAMWVKGDGWLLICKFPSVSKLVAFGSIN